MQSTHQWTDFPLLETKIVKALHSLGCTQPTSIQQHLLASYHKSIDFLIASQTGSGKTLAFLVPILADLMLWSHQTPQAIIALILTPTRELAQQIQAVIEGLLKVINSEDPSIIIPLEKQKIKKGANKTHITSLCVTGGFSKEKQVRQLTPYQPHILVGTPGRLNELLGDQTINFNSLKFLVIDEADRIVELGHFKEVDEILEKIFHPVLKETFEPEYKSMTQRLMSTAQPSFIKYQGKKVRLSEEVLSHATNQLFELPQGLFKIYEPIVEQPTGQDANPEAVIKKKKNKSISKRDQAAPPAEHSEFFNKIKRRVFFISATLTQQFDGNRYFFKKNHDQDSQSTQKRGRKEKDSPNGSYGKRDKHSKSRNNTDDDQRRGKGDKFGKNNSHHSKGKQQEEDSAIAIIPKLKALFSRVTFTGTPMIIDLSAQLFLPPLLNQLIVLSDGQVQKIALLLTYLSSLPSHHKTLIFSNTIRSSKRIQFYLKQLEFPHAGLHSQMHQKQRCKKLEQFNHETDYSCQILVCTDVAARGIDFKGTVTNVVQFGVPINGDTYVHRAGRTARANRKGQSLIIVDRKETDRWATLNAVLASKRAEPKRFNASKVVFDDFKAKIEKLEWIRVNQKHEEETAHKKRSNAADEELGQIQEESSSVDREDFVEHMKKARTKKEAIRREIKLSKFQKKEEGPKYRKNRLVMSPAEIRAMMNQQNQ